jgi:hypothetical protein
MKTQIKAEVGLVGVKVEQFTEEAQITFREMVADSMGLTKEHVNITSFSSSGVEVPMALSAVLGDELLQVYVETRDRTEGGVLKVDFEVHPPKDHATKAEARQLSGFLQKDGKSGFSGKLRSKVKKNGFPAFGRVQTLKEPVKKMVSFVPPKSARAVLSETILACGAACQPAGNLVNAAACEKNPQDAKCITCVSCAMPKMNKVCAENTKPACQAYKKAMAKAGDALVAFKKWQKHQKLWQFLNMMVTMVPVDAAEMF